MEEEGGGHVCMHGGKEGRLRLRESDRAAAFSHSFLLGEGEVQRRVDLEGELGWHLDVRAPLPALQHPSPEHQLPPREVEHPVLDEVAAVVLAPGTARRVEVERRRRRVVRGHLRIRSCGAAAAAASFTRMKISCRSPPMKAFLFLE